MGEGKMEVIRESRYLKELNFRRGRGDSWGKGREI